MPERPHIQNPERGCAAEITPLETLELDGEWSVAFRLGCHRDECPLRDWKLIYATGDSAKAAEDHLKTNTSSELGDHCLVQIYNEDDSGQTLLAEAIELKQRRDAEAFFT